MKNKRNIIKIVSVAAVLLIVVTIVAKCSSVNIKKGDVVAADSVISASNGFVYYNDADNNIWSRSIDSGETAIFAEDMTLLATDESGILATDGLNFTIYDEGGNITDSVSGIVVASAQLTSDYIYYKHIDSGYVVRIDRETKDVEDALPLEVNEFKVNENKIVFTTKANNMVYVYDMETGIPMGYFGDKNIGDFALNGNQLIYSDLNQGGKVSILDLSTGGETEIRGVQSANFTHKHGKLYYIENAKGNSKKYEIKNTEF